MRYQALKCCKVCQDSEYFWIVERWKARGSLFASSTFLASKLTRQASNDSKPQLCRTASATIPKMALEMARSGRLINKTLNTAAPTNLAARTLLRSSIPSLRAQKELHTTSRTRAPNTGLLGISSSNAPTSYFQRPSLPANTVVRFVPQQTAWIVERMGKFNRILQPGLAILWPFLDRIAYVKSLKENAIEIPSQSAITADNVTLELDGVLYTRVFDAYKAR